jgi:DNA-binding transcriptional LysR family regulator
MLNIPPGVDPDLLRSFVLIAEGGSVTRAAQRVGRTQSAVSMQMRRLEELLGQPLLIRGPRGLSPTPHGDWLLERAKRLLSLHDEIVGGFLSPSVAGRVRLGTPDDYALQWLPEILVRFAASHPAVEVEVVCAPSEELRERFRSGDVDVTLLSEGQEPDGVPATRLWRAPLVWVGPSAHAAHLRRPLPLALARPGCSWWKAATGALDDAGIAWRMAYVSSSMMGTHAPTVAGLAVTVGLPGPLPPGLRRLAAEEGLPPLAAYGIVLLHAEDRGAVAGALAEQIRASFKVPSRAAA